MNLINKNKNLKLTKMKEQMKNLQVGQTIAIVINNKQLSPKTKLVKTVPVWDDEEVSNPEFVMFETLQLEDWTYIEGKTKTFVPKGYIEQMLIHRKSKINTSYTLF